MSIGYGRQLVKRFRGEELKENPLEIIRLSPDILKLGLSNDDLFDYCKYSARFIFSKTHPDKVGEDIGDIARRYSQAFNLLGDRAIFDRAIAEFREMHSYQRAEERTLRAQSGNLRERVQHLETELRELQSSKAREANLRDWITTHLVKQGMRVERESATKSLAECHALTVVTFTFTTSAHPFDEKKLQEVQAYYRQTVKKEYRTLTHLLPIEQRTQLQGMVNRHHLDAVLLSSLIRRALKSKYKAPAIRWSHALALRERKLLRLVGLSGDEHRGVIQSRTVEDWTPDQLERYRGVLRAFMTKFHDVYVQNARFFPEKLVLTNQIITGDACDAKERLYPLGGVDGFFGLHHVDLNHRYSARNRVKDEIFYQTQPFVAPGDALVTIPAPKPVNTNAQGFKTEKLEKIARAFVENSYRVYLSHIIIDTS